MSLVYKGDIVLVNCTDPAGQQGARGVVDSTNYGGASRYHVGVRPDASPSDVHWHETVCVEVIQRANPEPQLPERSAFTDEEMQTFVEAQRVIQAKEGWL